MKLAKIYTNDFNRLIATTKAFVANDTYRSWMKYIKLEFHASENQVVAMATDGCRMSVEHSIISNCTEDFAVYIKGNVSLPKKQYATIELSDDGKEAIVRCKEFSFGYEQPKVEEFDWKKVIPTNEVKYRIGFNGNFLLSALQAAKISAGNSFREPVILEFRSNDEPILLRTNKEDIKMVLPVRVKR